MVVFGCSGSASYFSIPLSASGTCSGNEGLYVLSCSSSDSVPGANSPDNVNKLYELSESSSLSFCALAPMLFSGKMVNYGNIYVYSFHLPIPCIPTKRRQISEPLARIQSFLFSCSLRLWLSSDSPAIPVTNCSGISKAVMGVKSAGNALSSLVSITSVAMSSTNRFNATCTSWH